MSITDISFLFLFLPISFLVFLLKQKWQKYILLLLSLFFYACGSPKYFYLFVVMVFIDTALVHALCYTMTKADPPPQKSRKKSENNRPAVKSVQTFLLCAGIFLNLGLLFYYKYYSFSIKNVNHLLGTNFTAKDLLLPLGISFFVFKAVSLFIDVYRGSVTLSGSPAETALYLSFFAHVVSGPICRYGEFYQYSGIHKNEALSGISWSRFSNGSCLFVCGFCKKILLSNILSLITAEVFAMDLTETSSAILWLGSICYSLQLYYDFSGYSEMAAGIGEMFGIHCKENFHYPYCTSSVSEFWRRWHISLGSWFRDYVYIPLGGSRVRTKYRLYFNLAVVWLLTGIWHGANWTFIFWGFTYFIMISLEKAFNIPQRFQSAPARILYRIFTLLFINFEWVIFHSENISSGLRFIRHMIFGFDNTLADARTVILLQEYGIFILGAVIFSMPVVPWIRKSTAKISPGLSYAVNSIFSLLLCVLFVCAVSFVIAGQNNPFLYGNF